MNFKKYGISKDEILEVNQYDENENLIYLITRHIYKREHYLYKVTKDIAKKIDTQESPNDFKVLNKFYLDWQKKCEKQLDKSE